MIDRDQDHKFTGTSGTSYELVTSTSIPFDFVCDCQHWPPQQLQQLYHQQPQQLFRTAVVNPAGIAEGYKSHAHATTYRNV